MLRTIRRQQLHAMHHRDSFAQKRKRPAAHTRSTSLRGYGAITQKSSFKDLLAKGAIQKNPELLVNDVPLIHINEDIDDPNGNRSGKALASPGAYSLYAHDYMVQKKFNERKEQTTSVVTMEMMTEQPSLLSSRNVFSFDRSDIQQLMARSDEDDTLSQALLYDARYDESWKPLTNLSSEERKNLRNRAGWVRPLNRICEKIGIDSAFFTKNPKITLAEARNFILFQRLTGSQGPSEWLNANSENVRNPGLDEFFDKEWDAKIVQRRMVYYLKCTENDRDRLPMNGQYYNNIYLGKRMYGPGRKQKVVRTMIGGMEHRFEILDNPVNRIYFTHDACDRNLTKCRNRRVKCRDSTRVVLRYPSEAEGDFIHANYVKGGPLFNQFIVTQAPMDNTIGDFWRMVWQEQSPYIFMLTSRKEKQRCARYWPRTAGSSMIYHGLKIYNDGVDDYRYPLFRVTMLRILGPEDKELRVEHWQGDFNNSDNLAAPLQLLNLARNCSKPTIVHCHLGVSRSAVLVAIEICISSLLKGPSYKHMVQKAVHLLRSQRPFSVETPMQYIYIHRVLQYFMQPMAGELCDFRLEYKRWLDERAQRPFLNDIGQLIPGYRSLSPSVDADLIARTRHSEKSDYRREVPDSVGQLPLPLESTRDVNKELKLSKKYPRGVRYQ